MFQPQDHTAVTFFILSLVVLVPTYYALYHGRLHGLWRPVYAIGALFALYLNTFVLVVQAFLKVSFAIVQGILPLVMLVLDFASLRRFHPS